MIDRSKLLSNKPKVMFLCTGNSARSQMAEAFTRKYGGDRFEVHSAGLEPKGINPFTIQVMEEIGISLDEQRSKSLDEYLGKVHFAHLFTVCGHAEQNCPRIFLTQGKLLSRLFWLLKKKKYRKSFQFRLEPSRLAISLSATFQP